MRLQEMTGSA